ncbi:MAG: hypothetical protein L3J35_10625 [Bacteroidales bacterium]|nr:hypothetical protein [Bacteroidales bacterium]
MTAALTNYGNFEIELFEIKNEDCLKFTFEGKFTQEQAVSGTEEWRQLFEGVGNEKTTLVWDCARMTGFENNARIIWQKTMKGLKRKIKCVWLISNSKIIRTGANLMSKFVGFKIKAVKSEKEIAFC